MLNEFFRKLYDTVGCNSYIASFADPTRKILAIDTYAYSVDYFSHAVPVTATNGLNSNLIMDSDSEFVAIYFSCAALPDTVATSRILITNPAINIQITDKSAGKTYFSGPAPVSLMAGYMGFPFMLTSPKVIKPRTTLNVAYSSAQPGQIFDGFFFTIHGGRIYYE